MAVFRRRSPGGVTTPPPAPATPSPTTLHAGTPGRCPRCDGFGYIDRIDMVNRFQTQHCRTCGHSWEFSFDDDGDVIDLTDPGSPRR